MDFAFTEEQQKIEDLCRRFAQDHIAPHIKLFEEDLPERLKLFHHMGEQGLFVLALPRKDEGKADTIGYLSGLKAVSKVDAGIAVAMSVTNMVAEAILHFGTAEQRADYLPRIADGSCVPLSFAVTEKSAGSDVKAIETTFEEDPKDPRYLIINGSKHFITNADVAKAIIVFAKRKGGAAESISAFIVDCGVAGISVVKKESKLGLLTANLVALRFDNVRVSKASLLGKFGDGLKIGFASLDSGRLGIAAQALGIAEAAFEAALEFSKDRQQFGHPIGENQSIAFKLVDMRVKIDAGTLLMYRGACSKDQGKPFTLQAAEAKLYCSEVCNEIVGDAMQIHGGYGYIKDYPVEKYFRDARVTTIYEGTSEIQRIVISRHL